MNKENSCLLWSFISESQALKMFKKIEVWSHWLSWRKPSALLAGHWLLGRISVASFLRFFPSLKHFISISWNVKECFQLPIHALNNLNIRLVLPEYMIWVWGSSFSPALQRKRSCDYPAYLSQSLCTPYALTRCVPGPGGVEEGYWDLFSVLKRSPVCRGGYSHEHTWFM